MSIQVKMVISLVEWVFSLLESTFQNNNMLRIRPQLADCDNSALQFSNLSASSILAVYAD